MVSDNRSVLSAAWDLLTHSPIAETFTTASTLLGVALVMCGMAFGEVALGGRQVDMR